MKKTILYMLAAAAIIFATASFTTAIMSEKAAKVEMYQGLYVFERSKPADSYDYLGSVNAGSVIKNYKASYLVPLLIKKAKEKYPNANAIIFTEEDLWKADVVILK